jgi:hypothetical protein
VDRAHRLNITAEKQRAAEKVERQMDNLFIVIKHAFDDLNGLCDDPDDENALARHWLDRSNNSVSLQLAQIKYDLDQLAMLPPLENPALTVVQNLVYSLLVVRIALERENGDVPIDDAGRKRISTTAWKTKPIWSMALLRAHASIKAKKEQRAAGQLQ